MVRYNEIINESYEERIHTIMSDYFSSKPDVVLDGKYALERDRDYEITDGVVNVFSKNVYVVRPMNNIKQDLGIQFGKVKNSFSFLSTINPNSFEGCPFEVGGQFCCYSNPKLETLEYLPKKIGEIALLSNNRNMSLVGLDYTSNIDSMELSYYPELHMLRLFCLKQYLILESSFSDVSILVDIIEHHIKKYPNMKERIVKGQYAMIKAGYKGNAKW